MGFCGIGPIGQLKEKRGCLLGFLSSLYSAIERGVSAVFLRQIDALVSYFSLLTLLILWFEVRLRSGG